MVGDLLERHDLKGWPRARVVQLLGEPTSTDKWKAWDMIYVLGSNEYFGVDHEWLLIDLNEKGQVVGHRITSD